MATALYELVRDNLETLYGAIDDRALDVRLAKHQRKELEVAVMPVRGKREPVETFSLDEGAGPTVSAVT